MSWIKKNKFVAGLAGVTIVLVGSIFYYGSSQAAQYEERLAEYDELKAQNLDLRKSNPFPDQANLKQKQDEINKYEALIGDVKNTFAGFSAGELTELSPEEFNNRRVEMEKSLRGAFLKTELPEKTGFGFEKYLTEAAKPKATGMLAYQMDAMQWLFVELAKAKPEAITNIKRSDLNVERGVVSEADTQARSKKSRRNRKAKKMPLVTKKAYTLMPVEISFTASESGLRAFLESMVNSKQYFYALRALRIRNEKQIPPNIKDAGFASELAAVPSAGGVDFGDGLDLPADDSVDSGGGNSGVGRETTIAEPAAVKSERILKQVLGDEKLHVFLSFDIVYIEGVTQDKESVGSGSKKAK